MQLIYLTTTDESGRKFAVAVQHITAIKANSMYGSSIYVTGSNTPFISQETVDDVLNKLEKLGELANERY
ncbi:hypothetical protein A1D22_09325 [Pasteurellaceae bacterium LFhippo2]|nr:hypothetical protein [Pasteurellaceae bacterium LFhippo2]